MTLKTTSNLSGLFDIPQKVMGHVETCFSDKKRSSNAIEKLNELAVNNTEDLKSIWAGMLTICANKRNGNVTLKAMKHIQEHCRKFDNADQEAQWQTLFDMTRMKDPDGKNWYDTEVNRFLYRTIIDHLGQNEEDYDSLIDYLTSLVLHEGYDHDSSGLSLEYFQRFSIGHLEENDTISETLKGNLLLHFANSGVRDAEKILNKQPDFPKPIPNNVIEFEQYVR